MEPVCYDKIVVFHATVKSLKESQADFVDQLRSGTIGTAVFNQESVDGDKEVDFDRLRICKTTILTNEDEALVKGLFLKLRIAKEEVSGEQWELLNNLYPKEFIGMLWFGRKINVDLISRRISEYGECIELLVSPLSECVIDSIGYFVLPKAFFDSDADNAIILSIEKPISDRYDTKYEHRYLRSTIIGIEDYQKLNLTLKLKEAYFDSTFHEYIKDEIKKNQFGEYFNNLDILSFKAVAASHLGDYLGRIRQFLKRNWITDYWFSADGV